MINSAQAYPRRTMISPLMIVFFGLVLGQILVWLVPSSARFLVLWVVSIGLSAVYAWLVPPPRRWLVGLGSLVSILSVLSINARWNLLVEWWWLLVMIPLLGVVLIHIYSTLSRWAMPIPDTSVSATATSRRHPRSATHWRGLLVMLMTVHALSLVLYWAYNDHPCSWFDLTRRLQGCALVQANPSFPTNTHRVQFAPSGALVASAAGDDVPLPSLRTPENMTAYFQQLATTTNTISLWNVATGQLLRTLEQPAEVIKLTVSPNDQRVATTSFDGQARIWSVDDGSLQHTLPDTADVVFSADGSLLAATNRSKLIRLWSMQAGTLLRTITVDEEVRASEDIVFSPDGSLLAVREETNVTLWRVGDGTLQQTLDTQQFPNSANGSLSFSPDGQTLVTTGKQIGKDQYTVLLWRVADQTLLQKLIVNEPNSPEELIIFIHGITFSPDGTRLVADVLQTRQPSAIMIWRIADGALLDQVDRLVPTDLIHFNDDGTALQLYTASSDHVRIYTQRLTQSATE